LSRGRPKIIHNLMKKENDGLLEISLYIEMSAHDPIRYGIYESDIMHVYISIIRSVPEYACPVWQPGFTKTQLNGIERIHKRSLRIIYPKLTKTKALLISELDTLQATLKNITGDFIP